MSEPPIITDKEVVDWCEKHDKHYGYYSETQREAQRDADVEWYLNRISQEVARQSEKKAKLRQYYLNKIEQARQDTAREIFEEIEKNQGQYFYIESWPQYNTISISRNQIKWQALKQKYLGGKENPIGYDGNTR